MTRKPVIRPEVLPAIPDDRPTLGPVERFLADGRRARSRATYAKALQRAVTALGWDGSPFDYPWHLMRVEEATVLDLALREGFAARTRNQVCAAVRGVLEECLDMELLDSREHRAILKRLRSERPQKHEAKLPTDEELGKLAEVCRAAGKVGVRDLVIFELLQVLRRSELAALDLADVDLPALAVTVRDGKGGRTREEPLDPKCGKLLRSWLTIRGKKPGPFVGSFAYLKSKKGAVKYRGDRLSTQTVYDRCRQRCAQAGIPIIRPHDFRRLYCTKHLKNGTPLHVAQKLMGHSNPSTTMGYDQSGFDEMKKWAGNGGMPWNQ